MDCTDIIFLGVRKQTIANESEVNQQDNMSIKESKHCQEQKHRNTTAKTWAQEVDEMYSVSDDDVAYFPKTFIDRAPSHQDERVTFNKPWLQKMDEVFSFSGDAFAFPRDISVDRCDTKGNYEVIRRHVPFLTRTELHSLGGGRLLGEGGFGRVRLVTWENGDLAVVKELLQDGQLLPVLAEATMLLQLSGAGGAPKLLGTCM